MSSPKLPFHEWIIIFLIIVLMLSLAVVTHLRDQDPLPETGHAFSLYSDTYKVTISGAVSKPDTYILKKGATLKVLLDLAEPLPNADLSKVNLKRKLKDEETFYIPSKKLITVYLEGAVANQGPLHLYEGSSLQDLLQNVEFLPNADKRSLKKKRILKDEEIVVIPAKTPSKRKTSKKSEVGSQDSVEE